MYVATQFQPARFLVFSNTCIMYYSFGQVLKFRYTITIYVTNSISVGSISLKHEHQVLK